MNTVWCPVPVSLFLRRVFNVISTFSIAHHYALPAPNPTSHNHADGTTRRCPMRWLNVNEITTSIFEMNESRPALVEHSDWEMVDRMSSVSIPWPRLRWSTMFFSNSPRRSHPDLESSVQPESSPPPPNPTSTSSQQPSPKQRRRERRKRPVADETPNDTIHQLLLNPALTDPIRTPRFPIVLCHGLYGFDVRGPSAIPALRMHYWSDVRNILRKTVRADLIIGSVPGTGSIAERAQELDRFLCARAAGRGVNLLAHSMGGLDGRHLITHIRPTEYSPLSLTTIATPHRGSPFMDWCTDYLGLGRTDVEKEKQALSVRAAREISDDSVYAYGIATGSTATSSASFPASATSPTPSVQESATATPFSLAALPSSLVTLLLSMFDSPAYSNLTTSYLERVFNPRTPNDPRVRYFSVGGVADRLNVWHPLWLPKLVVDSAEEREREGVRDPEGAKEDSSACEQGDADSEPWGNDGLVTVRSARWGEYLGTLRGADHWRLRGAGGLELGEHLPGLVSAHWSRITRALGHSASEPEHRVSHRARVEDDRRSMDALNRSTERMSAVLDWLVEQVPTDRLPSLPFVSSDAADVARAEVEAMEKEQGSKKRKRNGDLETDEDLERFYVALARKLYDEGL